MFFHHLLVVVFKLVFFDGLHRRGEVVSKSSATVQTACSVDRTGRLSIASLRESAINEGSIRTLGVPSIARLWTSLASMIFVPSPPFGISKELVTVLFANPVKVPLDLFSVLAFWTGGGSVPGSIQRNPTLFLGDRWF